MKQSNHTLYTHLGNLQTSAQILLDYADKQKVWLFEGELGVGKTTLIKALCSQLGVQDNVTSPTFSLINEYSTSSGALVYHFDFYRLEHEEEALDLDCTTYFNSNNYCFVEWPTKVPSLIPPIYYKVCISNQSPYYDERVIEFSLHESHNGG